MRFGAGRGRARSTLRSVRAAVVVWVGILAGCAAHRGPARREVSAAEVRAAAAAPPYAGITRCGPDRGPRAPAPGSVGERDFLIDDQIEARAPALRRCYLRTVAQGASPPERRVLAELDVYADGAVANVSITGFDPGLDACLCDVLARLAIRPGRGPIRVRYPLIFGPG